MVKQKVKCPWCSMFTYIGRGSTEHRCHRCCRKFTQAELEAYELICEQKDENIFKSNNPVHDVIEEAIILIEKNGQAVNNIKFVTDGERSCSWSEFLKNARHYYDKSRIFINPQLKIVGRFPWWLERKVAFGRGYVWSYFEMPVQTRPGRIRISYDETVSN